MTVVGAGIGGSATALLCARAGARVTLFERQAEPRTAGGGILLQPNGLAVLYGLDLDERLRRRGHPVSCLRIADADGRRILDIALPRFTGELDHALAVERTELLSALLDLVAAEPGIECRFGAEVVDALADGTLRLRGAEGAWTTPADLLVAADGARSLLRQRSGLRAVVSDGPRYVRGLGAAVPGEETTEYWTGLGIFGVAPVDHRTYFWASTESEPLASALDERSLPRFRQAWADVLPVAGEVLAGVDRLENLVVDRAVRVDCPRWTAGRLVLLGDAAHAMAPNVGQGAGSALADAAVLVWELTQRDDVPAALARYEERRRPGVRAVQDIAGWLGQLSDVTEPVLRSLRDAALRLFGGRLVGEVGVRLLEQEDPLYLRLVAGNPRGTVAPA